MLAFKLTPGNVDDRKPVPEMTKGIFGKLFGDRGYISQDLFEKLYEQRLQLITRYKKNMKQKLVGACHQLRGRMLLRGLSARYKEKNVHQLLCRAWLFFDAVGR